MKYMLNDICFFVDEKIFLRKLTKDTYISTENMLTNRGGITVASALPSITQTQAFKVGDVLVSNIRPYFKKIWHATFNGGCSNDVLVFRAKESIDSDFLYYVLADDAFFNYATRTSKGTKMPRGDKSAIMQYGVPNIALPLQTRIAHILKPIDSKISLNNAINHNLQQQAQTLFKKWFIGKNMGFKDVSLSTLMSYAGGSQPPASEFIATPRDGYVRFVQIRDYETDGHITYIPISSKNKLCEETDIMIARYGASLGRICFGLNGAYNVALAKVFPKKPYYREFLRCYLSSRDFYEGINNRGGRSAQAGFNESDIRSFILSFPCDEMLVREFENTASPMFAQRLSLLKENRKLVGIRDTLLPKLMSGEIDVSDIQL